MSSSVHRTNTDFSNKENIHNPPAILKTSVFDQPKTSLGTRPSNVSTSGSFSGAKHSINAALHISNPKFLTKNSKAPLTTQISGSRTPSTASTLFQHSQQLPQSTKNATLISQGNKEPHMFNQSMTSYINKQNASVGNPKSS